MSKLSSSDKTEILKASVKGATITGTAAVAGGIVSGAAMTTVTTAAPGVMGYLGLATVTATVCNPVGLTIFAVGGVVVGGTIAARTCYNKIKEVNDTFEESQKQANSKRKKER